MSNGNRVIALGDGERESRRKCVHGVASVEFLSRSSWLPNLAGTGLGRVYIKSRGLRISLTRPRPLQHGVSLVAAASYNAGRILPTGVDLTSTVKEDFPFFRVETF